MRTGAHRSPYRSGWYTSRYRVGTSSVSPSYVNAIPVAPESRSTASCTSCSDPWGAVPRFTDVVDRLARVPTDRRAADRRHERELVAPLTGFPRMDERRKGHARDHAGERDERQEPNHPRGPARFGHVEVRPQHVIRDPAGTCRPGPDAVAGEGVVARASPASLQGRRASPSTLSGVRGTIGRLVDERSRGDGAAHCPPGFMPGRDMHDPPSAWRLATLLCRWSAMAARRTP